MTDESRTPKPDAASEGGADAKQLPAIDFSTFMLSLSTSALCQMGLVPDPTTGSLLEPDKEIARQTIAAIEMLREKTRGNLDDEERRLIDSLLYELRLKFVELPG